MGALDRNDKRSIYNRWSVDSDAFMEDVKKRIEKEREKKNRQAKKNKNK